MNPSKPGDFRARSPYACAANGSNGRFDFTAEVPAAGSLGSVHFIAIGGAGMSGVARVMLARGLTVSGSDAKQSLVLAALVTEGAQVYIGHDAAHLGDADTVVISSAIREDNVELAGGPLARAPGAASIAGSGIGDAGEPPGGCGRRQRQDHDDGDAGGRTAVLRGRPVVRRRR